MEIQSSILLPLRSPDELDRPGRRPRGHLINRPRRREVLECGGWRGTGLTPLLPVCRGPEPKRCVPSPLTHRTPKCSRVGQGAGRIKSQTRTFRTRVPAEDVAQISNLLFRRFLTCGCHALFQCAADWKSAKQQIGNLRYACAGVAWAVVGCGSQEGTYEAIDECAATIFALPGDPLAGARANSGRERTDSRSALVLVDRYDQ